MQAVPYYSPWKLYVVLNSNVINWRCVKFTTQATHGLSVLLILLRNILRTYEGIGTVLLLLVFCRIHYKMYIWHIYFMSILHLHHDKLYILVVRVLTLYGLTGRIMNELMTVLKLTNVTTFVYSCCSNNNFIWSNKPVMFYTPLFVREKKSHSKCQRQPTPQHNQQDSTAYKHRTLTHHTLVVTDRVVTARRSQIIIWPWVLSHHHRWTRLVEPGVRDKRYIDNNLIFTDLQRHAV
jgi:hypothetical protein